MRDLRWPDVIANVKLTTVAPVEIRMTLDRRSKTTASSLAERAKAILWPGLIAAAVLAATGAMAQVAEAPALPVPPVPPVETTTPDAPVRDPFQKVNRASFNFSMALDRAVSRPVSHAYMAVTSRGVRARINAAVTNLGEPRTILNDVAQGRPTRAGRATSRLLINSTLGVLGLFDVADGMGLPYHRSDFGQTLGRYGFTPGAYLYVPVLGPLTMRDGAGRLVDFATDPVTMIGGGYKTTFGATRLGVGLLDARVNVDGAIRALDDATDPYATVRSAYLQRRSALIREATGKAEELPDF